MNPRRIMTLVGALCAMLLLSFGCSGPEGPDPTLSTSGVALSVDFVGNTDVAAMKFTVARVACDGEGFEPFTQEKVVALEGMALPDAPAYEDNPFAVEASHLFADAFFWLPQGCYDVDVVPLNAAGEPSVDCGGAHADAVAVNDGAVTEITLVMQCEGPEMGGLDVVGTLNHPPLIDLVVYAPSKFVFVCEPATLCAYASDPDGDPLEFAWATLGSDFTVLYSDPSGSSCIEITVPEPATEMITVTVFDLYVDEYGMLQRIENLVAPATSRDSVQLPLHVAAYDDTFGCGLN